MKKFFLALVLLSMTCAASESLTPLPKNSYLSPTSCQVTADGKYCSFCSNDIHSLSILLLENTSKKTIIAQHVIEKVIQRDAFKPPYQSLDDCSHALRQAFEAYPTKLNGLPYALYKTIQERSKFPHSREYSSSPDPDSVTENCSRIAFKLAQDPSLSDEESILLIYTTCLLAKDFTEPSYSTIVKLLSSKKHLLNEELKTNILELTHSADCLTGQSLFMNLFNVNFPSTESVSDLQSKN